jgi:2-methylcitrate dehydratase PrpD
MAADLAERGVTGAPYVLEGSAFNGGFTQITTSDKPNLNLLTEGLGERFSIMDVYFKPYTACRHTHGAAQAVLELKADSEIAIPDIDAILVSTYGIAELAVGKGVDASSSFVTAQFSIPYVTAICLLDGELGPLQLTEKRVSDADVLSLAEKVAVRTDPELNSVYPGKTSSRVEIQMKDGRTFSHQVDIPKGDPRDPMGDSDISQKVRAFARNRDVPHLEDLIDALLHLEEFDDVALLAEMI